MAANKGVSSVRDSSGGSTARASMSDSQSTSERSRTTCAYVFRCSCGECPSQPAASATGTPDRCHRLALRWRRSCGENAGCPTLYRRARARCGTHRSRSRRAPARRDRDPRAPPCRAPSEARRATPAPIAPSESWPSNAKRASGSRVRPRLPNGAPRSEPAPAATDQTAAPARPRDHRLDLVRVLLYPPPLRPRRDRADPVRSLTLVISHLSFGSRPACLTARAAR